MLAVEINFLTGRYVATFHNDRQQSEWPPHPARLFSAMVATYHESDDPDPTERAAMEWLEAQPPPSVAASPAVTRTVASHFVPVNDTAIISRSWQERRAESISELIDQINDEFERSGGEVTKKVSSLRDKLAKAREVTSQTDDPGNTPPGTAIALFPDHRGKQERFFPSVTPDEPRATYIWENSPPPPARESLDRLLQRVTRLGHSSSLVSCRVVAGAPSPNWTPVKGSLGTEEGIDVLRTTGSGQLAELERRYNRHEGIKPRSLPFVSVRYKTQSEAPSPDTQTPNTAAEWIVFEFAHKSRSAPSSRSMPSTRAVEVAEALRATIFHHADDPIPEGLSGHRPDGTPSERPHAAFLPLPYVGYEHSDGRLLGIALSRPKDLDDRSTQALYRAIGKWEAARNQENPLRLTFGAKGVIELKRLTASSTAVTLRKSVWSRASRKWASATPIALPKHPGPLGRGTASARSRAWELAEKAVVSSCRHVGLPAPLSVELSLTGFIPGARPALKFPPFRQGRDNKQARRLMHAMLTFENPVEGPLLLGAGRFVGLGLMRPMPEGRSSDE